MPSWLVFSFYLSVMALGLPVLMFLLLDDGIARARRRSGALVAATRQRLQRRPPPAVVTPVVRGSAPSGPPRPIEKLAADLRRLSKEIDRASGAERLPGRMLRLQATTLAYDLTLINACIAVGLDLELAAPLADVERLELEAELAQAGMRW